jgi:DNA-binding SARP family transcriptional activator
LLGNREGFTNTIQWVPRLVAALCAEALEANIETEYVIRLIKSRQLSPPAACYFANWPRPIAIRTLGHFELRIDGELLQFSRKAQKKPLELLKLLIVRGAKGVGAESIIDNLWPDSDGDAAHNAFDSTLHRLRKLLKQDDAILLSEGKLSLNATLCWLDIWALERLADEMPIRASTGESEWHATQLLQIYRGPFFSGDLNFPGRSQTCAAFRSVFERCISALCRSFDASGKTEQAVDLLKKGLEIDADAHDLHILLNNLRGLVPQ